MGIQSKGESYGIPISMDVHNLYVIKAITSMSLHIGIT
jgi:hypothetical protein